MWLKSDLVLTICLCDVNRIDPSITNLISAAFLRAGTFCKPPVSTFLGLSCYDESTYELDFARPFVPRAYRRPACQALHAWFHGSRDSGRVDTDGPTVAVLPQLI